jgi:sRNA-binding protein
MSNLSLQEQLQALGEATPQAKQPNPRPTPSAPKFANAKPASPKPAWLEYVFYGLELLKAHYPECFKEPREMKPLKIGIKQDLVKHLSSRDDIVINDKTCMIKSLSYYVTTLNYFRNVTATAARIGLDGQVSGQVSPEEARYSLEQYQAKIQKKTSRPQRKPQPAATPVAVTE